MEPSATGADIVQRLWAQDYTLWPASPDGIADHLGWLHSVERLLTDLPEIHEFAADAAAAGLRAAVVLGVGGPSLAAEVLYSTFGATSRALRLYVLDTTDPYSIRQIEQILDLQRTLFVVASKTGTTIEVRSLLDYFWERLPDGRHYAAITDRGSPLEALGAERGFRRIWLSDPAIGDRYSALSFFGLVPAALIGVDVQRVLEAARSMAAACQEASAENPGLALGLALGRAALAGRDKLTLTFPAPLSTLGYWVEQLVAGSTGQRGRGILPVEGEALGPPEVYGPDRLFVATGHHGALDALKAAGHPVVRLPFHDRPQIGGELFRWEFATAVAAHLLGVNPFDEPDPAAAQAATTRSLEQGSQAPATPPLESVLASVRPGDYLAIQAYLPRTSPNHEAIQAARLRLRDHCRVATTLGYGPRYLHATGRYHQDGPNTGAFIQVVQPDTVDLPIPGKPYTFSQLKQAQALGDLQQLQARGRRTCRVTLDQLRSAAGRLSP